MTDTTNLADRLEAFIPRGDGYNSDYANTLTEAVEALRSVQSAQVQGDGWIPVGERLPEIATDVLVYGLNHGSASYTVAGLFSGSWASQETEETTRFEPTHWMPLPSVPKGGE